jgi:hypothetical protein
MPGRRPHIPVRLGNDAIRIILRGADDLILRGGRMLLARLLKGSREKRLLELGLDRSPAYGALHDRTLSEIQARIDWLIRKGFLRLEYEMPPFPGSLVPGHREKGPQPGTGGARRQYIAWSSGVREIR